MKLEFSQLIFEKKSSNAKSHENLSNGSWVVSCGKTYKKLIVTSYSVWMWLKENITDHGNIWCWKSTTTTTT